HQILRVMVKLSVLLDDHHHALSFFQGLGDRLSDSRTILRICHDTVHHNLDVVYLVTINLHLGRDVEDLTVDPHLGVTRLPDLLKEFAVMTLASLHDRRQHDQLLPFEFIEDRVKNLFLRLAYHPFPTQIRVSFAGACEKEPHEIVDFGNGTNG